MVLVRTNTSIQANDERYLYFIGQQSKYFSLPNILISAEIRICKSAIVWETTVHC
jgi:hypothetical protein